MADPYDINTRFKRPGAGYGALQSDSGAFRALAKGSKPAATYDGPLLAPSTGPGATPDVQYNFMDGPVKGARDPMFANVRGHTDTVADNGNGAPIDMKHQYADAPPPPLEAANAKYGNLNPRDVSADTRGAEAERKAALGGIDDALFGLRGNLNMRSKREMYTNLLGQKNDLTKQAYETQNNRDVAGARMASEAAQQNASLQEQAAKRRDDINSFNVQEGDRRDISAAELADKRQARAAAEPFKKLQARAIETQINVADAAARRADANYDLEHDAKLEKGALDFANDYRKGHPGASDNEINAARLAVEAQGTGPVTPSTRAAIQEGTNSIEDRMNQGTPWLDDLGMGVVRAPMSQNETDPSRRGTLSPQDISYTPAGGFVGLAQKFLPGEDLYMATPAGQENDPRAPRTYVPASEAQAQMRVQNALRARAKRRAEEDAAR